MDLMLQHQLNPALGYIFQMSRLRIDDDFVTAVCVKYQRDYKAGSSTDR